jgi:hypothetical protein
LVFKDFSVSLLDSLWFLKTFLFLSLILYGFQPSTQEEGKAEQQKTFLFLSLIFFLVSALDTGGGQG